MTGSRRTLAWALLAVVVVVGLAVALQSDDTARTPEDRVFAIARSTKCPTCRSQSVAESNAPVAQEIRDVIATRVEAGDSNEEIEDLLVSRFGEEVQLNPAATGVTGLVWVLPVVAFVVAVVGLGVVLSRSRARAAREASEADRALVEEALAHEDGGGPP